MTTAAPRTAEILCHAEEGYASGNRVTAERWRRRLGELGLEATIAGAFGAAADLHVAIHAGHCRAAIRAAARAPRRPPLFVLLSGTDLYGALPRAELFETLASADRILLLQELARAALPERLAARAVVVPQSAEPPPGVRPAGPGSGHLEALLVANLRAVKDPFLAVEALRLLPSERQVVVSHAGAELDAGMADRARQLMACEPRYRWLGPLPRAATLARIAAAGVLLLTSRAEGGANVVSEALVAGVPVLSTRTDGSVGILGAAHPGLFDVGDAAGLARLLDEAARDPRFLAGLAECSKVLAPRYHPDVERAVWRGLLADFGLLPGRERSAP